MSARSGIRVLVVVAVALAIQTTVLLDVRIDGMIPDLMLLLPIAAGLVGGPSAGAGVGFVSGFAADLLLPTPFGLSALVGTLIGFVVGAASGAALGRGASAAGGALRGSFPVAPRGSMDRLARAPRGFSTLVALVASALGVLGYAVLGALMGDAQFLRVAILAAVAVVAVANAVLAGPAVKALHWALGAEARPRSANRR